MKTLWRLFVVCLSFSLVLIDSGCSRLHRSANEPFTHPDKIKLTFWDENAGPNRTPYYQELFRRFMAENPDIEIDYVGIPLSINKSKYDVSISSDNMPDVAAVNANWIADFASKGALLPLDAYFERWPDHGKIMPSFIEYNRTLVPDRRLYQIPNTFYTDVFWYRKDLLSQSGIQPLEHWENFFIDVRALTDPSMNRYGYSLRGGDGSITQLTSMMYAYSGISNYFTPEGICTINDPRHVEFLKRYVALYRSNTPVSDIVNGYRETVATFDNGLAAIIQHNFGSYNDHLRALGPDQFAATLLPSAANGKRTLITVANGYSIFRTTRQPEAAWKLVQFLLEGENQHYWNEHIGQMPTNEDTLYSDYVRNSPYIQAVLNAMKDPNTAVLPVPIYLPDYNNMMKQLLEPEFQRVLTGTLNVETFLNEWARAMEQSFASYRKQRAG